jgi:signal transduction histidine kinase
LSNQFDIVSLVLAGIVVLGGLLRLADYVFGLGLHLDLLLFPGRVTSVGVYPPSEMAPNTALNFVLCGLGLLLFDVETWRGFRPGQALVLVAGLIALLALVGYSYRVLSLYRIGQAIPMALDSAIEFSLFCLGYLASRPRRGLMTIITSHTTGGAVARRLLPVAILMPWVLGGVLLAGEHGGYYEREFAVSIFAASSIVIFTSLIWWNAKLLYLVDIERVQSERRLAVQHNCTRVLAEARNLAEAIPRLIETACRTLGWQMGAKWAVDANTQTIHCIDVWVSPSADLAEFAELTRKSIFKAGEGLPGQVWATGQAQWAEDVAIRADLPRSSVATNAGLHGALAFPIRFGQETFGVMEFFSTRVERPDEMLLEMLTTVGTQVGLFVERTTAERELRRTTANLERSNTDLQQFAYVASHDLSEPLRMVTSYLQLLAERYQPKLDKQGAEFVAFAVDGAQRMQALIHDLLAYSRVDLRGRSFEPTNCDLVFQAAIANLKIAIEESGATVTHAPLPTVLADSVQLTQVFQNLIGNALKFRGAQPPRIEVGAQRHDSEWLLFVRDNGIGIDPKHFDRIFVIFQRLHTRHEYAGTGMGLAICKKIIERHGGRIWLESTLGKGSTFLFTLPLMNDEEENVKRET